MARKPINTVEPVDLALESGSDPALSDRLIAHHIDLAKAQLAELRIKRVLWGGLVFMLLLGTALLGFAAIRASQSRALVIEPFHVPPSLAARGLDGSVVASRMIDRLQALKTQSDSSRAEDSYAFSGAGDIKIAIPNTGVSISDVWRYLREWLGHDRAIGGDAAVIGNEVAVTARLSGGTAETFRAPLADPTPAIDAAALSIFKQTQPYRYALVIGKTEGFEASIPLLRKIAEEGEDVRERQWGYVGWENALSSTGRLDEAVLRARQGAALDPSFGKIQSNLANGYQYAGRNEEALATNRVALPLFTAPEHSTLSAAGFGHSRAFVERGIADSLGDDRAGLEIVERQGQLPEYLGNARFARMQGLVYLAHLGEYRRAAQLIPLLPFNDPAFASAAFAVAALFAEATGRPERAVRLNEQSFALAPLPKGLTVAEVYPPNVADHAEMLLAAGRVADAERAIAPTRRDCYPCLIARGEIAAAQGDRTGAARWFADAASQGPSLPQADYYWGKMLAAAGDRDGAQKHFAVASARGPNWYEPPLASGRLLIALRRFDDAVEALQQAKKAAPRRADVTIALGRAQWLTGDRDGAKKTWAAARRLDLLAPDKAWLAKIDRMLVPSGG